MCKSITMLCASQKAETMFDNNEKGDILLPFEKDTFIAVKAGTTFASKRLKYFVLKLRGEVLYWFWFTLCTKTTS